MSLGEFLLPVIIVFLSTFIYWRDLWFQIALLIIIFLPIFSFLTVKDISIFSRETENKNYDKNFLKIKSWTRKEVLADFKFYTMLPALLAPPFIITGIVINQSFITESKQWGEYVIAQSFMFYSVLTVITLFIAGNLIDKFTSKKILPYLNLPILISLIILIFFDQEKSAFIFMGLFGITNGLAQVLLSSLWAEVYGVNYLGSIKALTTALMVFATAFGTALFGILIDFGFTIEQIAVVSGLYI